MTKSRISQRVVADRMAWIERMLREIRALPLHSSTSFFADSRNVWAAESCLRRALEALLDLGRHILAKGFATGVTEYKEVATKLEENGVLKPPEAALLRTLAGYRNRLVHFYHEVSREELFQVCRKDIKDIETILHCLQLWIKHHPERIDKTL